MFGMMGASPMVSGIEEPNVVGFSVPFAQCLPVSDLRNTSAFCAFCSAVDGVNVVELAIGNLLCVVIAFGYRSKIAQREELLL